MHFSRFKTPLLFFFSLSLVLFAACHRTPRGPQSVIRMSDLHTKNQLLRGFYELEAGAWRWTEPQFVCTLAVPAAAKGKGGELLLQGSLTDGAVESGPLTVSATINGKSLGSQTLTKAGTFVVRLTAPADALIQPVVVVEFNLNHGHHIQNDQRVLGLIASVITLKAN